MSRIETGIGAAGGTAIYTVDMRDEIITNATQLTDAIYRFKIDHLEEIGWIRLSLTQEYCVRADCAKYSFDPKDDRPRTPEELGQLEQFMGYSVIVGDGSC